MTQWDFLARVLDYLLDSLEVKYQTILNNQQTILANQARIKELLMSVKTTVEQFAAQVNVFSTALAAAIENVRGDLADLKAKLVDATTEAEVEAILQPALTNLGSVSAALEALAAENEPTIPPVEPPVEPL
jgi:hypothetical protein